MSEQNPGDVTAHPSPDDPTVGFGGELRAAFAEVHIRDEHPATEAIRHALAEGKRRLAEALRQLEAQRRRNENFRRRDNDDPAA